MEGARWTVVWSPLLTTAYALEINGSGFSHRWSNGWFPQRFANGPTEGWSTLAAAKASAFVRFDILATPRQRLPNPARRSSDTQTFSPSQVFLRWRRRHFHQLQRISLLPVATHRQCHSCFVTQDKNKKATRCPTRWTSRGDWIQNLGATTLSNRKTGDLSGK